MEPGFKYYGGVVDPSRKRLWSDEPVTQKEKDARDIRFFAPVYEDQINKFIRGRTRVMSKNAYESIAPQQGAFTHIVDTLIKNGQCVLKNIILHTFTTDKMIFAVQLSIPAPSKAWSLSASKNRSTQKNGNVLVTFYIGLCDDFMQLVDKNDDIEVAMQAVKHTSAGSVAAIDPLFVPNEVIPDVLKSLRAEQRYCYLPQNNSFNENPLKNYFYKTPEGFIFRVEIDGYNILEDIKTTSLS